MKIRKAVKKMVALGTGMTMVGATMLGAGAADLSEYPSPLFIENGMFDGVLVVGAAAAASDVVGSVDIATSLQAASTVTTKIKSAGGTTVTVTGDAAQVTEGSDMLEIGELLKNVKETFTDDDLAALASGTLTNNKGSFDYNQYLNFNGSIEYVDYAIDDDDDDDIPADYLYIANGEQVFDWELEFSSPAESDFDRSATGDPLDDFEDETLWILGRPYTMVTAKTASTHSVELVFFGGDVRDVLAQDEAATYTLNGVDYEVTPTFIGTVGSTNKVKFNVNGHTTKSIEDGATDKLPDGTEIGVSDILVQDFQGGTRQVEFYLGANKIKMKDTNITKAWSGGTLEVNEETIDDVHMEIVGTEDATNSVIKLSSLKLRVLATDDLYVGKGKGVRSQLDEPEAMLSNDFDLTFEGLKETSAELMKIKSSGDDQYKLEFTNRNGDTYDVELFSLDSSGNINLGSDKFGSAGTENLHLTESVKIEKNDQFVVNDDVENGFTHVLEYKGQSVTDDTLTFRDIGTGKSIEISYAGTGTGNDAQLILSGKTYAVNVTQDSVKDGNITIDLTGDGDITGGEATVIVTGNEGMINWTHFNTSVGTGNANFANMTITTRPDNIDDATTKEENVITLKTTDSGTKFDITRVEMKTEPTGGSGYQTGYFKSNMNKIGDEDNRAERNVYGALFEQSVDTSGPDSLTINYPKGQAEPLVYFTAGAVTTSTSESEEGTLETTTITPIEVGAAKLDSEVPNIRAVNAIVVGGPCANKAAAELTGVANTVPECLAGLTLAEGEAIIKLYEHTGGKVSLLVAGATADDTRRAAIVVANSGDYALTGTEVSVTGTTMTDITVAAVTAEEPAAEEAMDEEGSMEEA